MAPAWLACLVALLGHALPGHRRGPVPPLRSSTRGCSTLPGHPLCMRTPLRRLVGFPPRAGIPGSRTASSASLSPSVYIQQRPMGTQQSATAPPFADDRAREAAPALPAPLHKVLRAVVGFHTGPLQLGPPSSADESIVSSFAELNVVNVTEWTVGPDGAPAAAVLEELCVTPHADPTAAGSPALPPTLTCRRSIVHYSLGDDDEVLAARYMVPSNFTLAHALVLSDLLRHPAFAPAVAPIGSTGDSNRSGAWRYEHTWGPGDHGLDFVFSPSVSAERLDPAAYGAVDSATRLHLQLRHAGPPRAPLTRDRLVRCEARPQGKRRAFIPQENILHPRLVLDECVLRMSNEEPPLHCAFIHGAGGDVEEDGIVVDQFEFYWGPIHEYTPKCHTRWFLMADTIHNGWDAEHLQKLACKVVLGPRAPGTTLAHHTTVIAHSMGNLILAAALRNGHCEWDRSTNRWLSVAGPWNAEAVPRLARLCAGSNPLDATAAYAAKMMGFCLGREISPGYASLDPEYAGLWRLLPYAKKFITAAMCGTSASGLPHWLFTPALPAISHYLSVDDPNDGVVSVESCSRVIPFNGTWGRNPHAKWYLADLNHVDVTGRHGNGRGLMQSPLSWYQIHHHR